MSDTTICCPHCSHRYDSEVMELLDLDVLHDFRCEHCAMTFAVLIKECQICNADSIFTWAEKPGPEQLEGLHCKACERLLDREDEPDD